MKDFWGEADVEEVGREPHGTRLMILIRRKKSTGQYAWGAERMDGTPYAKCSFRFDTYDDALEDAQEKLVKSK